MSDRDLTPISLLTIGYFTRHELDRLVEERPDFVYNMIKIDQESEAGGASYFIEEYARPNAFEKDRHADSSNLPRTEYRFFVGKIGLSLIINPPGPISLYDDQIWIDKTQMPDAAIAHITQNAIGAKLSDYIEIAGHDLDALAPNGIKSIKSAGTVFGPTLVLNCEMERVPYQPYIEGLKHRAIQLINETKAREDAT